ncbi:MAG: hypothetical protein C5B49_09250 [Bdellovibrio sp.]|nr:MAG: hypothetical protein C5B49_09250 [Bdellovibrio sp.]
MTSDTSLVPIHLAKEKTLKSDRSIASGRSVVKLLKCRVAVILFPLLCHSYSPAIASNDLGCVDTTFRLMGRNDQVCISAFDDPQVPGVACHISQARSGGLGGSLGLAEDPSRFSIACRQVGPITVNIGALGDKEKVYSDHTSIFFKHTQVFRVIDRTRNTLIYLAVSDKLIDGSPQNAISSVPVMPWGSER